MADERSAPAPVDLLAGDGHGPLWGTASQELNATLLAWPPGHTVAEHVNAERDVLLVVVEGAATVIIDDADHLLRAPAAILIPRRSSRRIVVGPDGVRYLTSHRVRPGIELRPERT